MPLVNQQSNKVKQDKDGYMVNLGSITSLNDSPMPTSNAAAIGIY